MTNLYEWVSGVISIVNNDLVQVGQKLAQMKKAKGKAIDRIILYIDDRDCCPSMECFDQ